MDEQQPLSLRRAVDADALTSFLDALREAGYGIGADQAVAVHDAVLYLVAGDEAEPQRVARFISPIVSRTPEEQDHFHEHFRAWQERILPAQRTSTSPRPAPARPAATAAARDIEAIARTRFLGHALFVIGVLFAALGIWRFLAPPEMGRLTLITTPQAALVWIVDGPVLPEGTDSLGPTPLHDRTLPAGTYLLRIAHPAHADTVQEVRITADSLASFEVRLTAITGRLSLRTEPEGAHVLLDATDIGVTPIDTVVPVGRRQVWYAMEGHRPVLDSVDVRAGAAAADAAPVTFESLSPDVPVHIRTEPAGATVAIDSAAPAWLGDAAGTRVGNSVLGWLQTRGLYARGMVVPFASHSDPAPALTPGTWSLPRGEYRLRIRRPEHRDTTITLTVSDAAIDRTLVLTELPRFRIVAWTDSATLLVVNGDTLAPGDSLLVPEGPATVRYELPGFEPRTETIQVADDLTLQTPGDLVAIRQPRVRVAFTPRGDSLIAGRIDGSGPLLRWAARRMERPDSVARDSLRMMTHDHARGPVAVAAGAPPDRPPFVAHHQHLVGDVAISPDSLRMAITDPSGSLTLWRAVSDSLGRITTYALTDTLIARRRFSTVRYSPDGRMLALGADDGELLLHAIVPIREDSMEAGGDVLAFSTDGRLLAAAGYGGEIVVRDMTSGERTDLGGETSAVTALLFDIAGVLLVGRANGTLEFRDPPYRDVADAWPLGARIEHVVASGEGHLVQLGDGLRYRVRRSDQGIVTELTTDVPVPRTTVAAPDGAYLVTGNSSGRLILVAPGSGQGLDTLAVGPGPVRRVDGTVRRIAAAWQSDSGGITFQIWNAGRRRPTPPDSTEIVAAAYATDIEPLLTDTADAHLAVADLAFSPDGRHLATIDTAGRVIIWNPGAPRTLGRHAQAVRDLAFSPIEPRIAAAVGDAIVFRSTETGDSIGSIANPGGAPVEGIAFSPDGLRFVTSAADTVRLWRTGSRMASIGTAFAAPAVLLPLGVMLLGVVLVLAGPYVQARYLVRRSADEEPVRLERVRLRDVEGRLFDDLHFFLLARALRRRSDVATTEIDVPRTVRATAAGGGRFSPAFRARLLVPEYLVLIDRTTFADHQARLVDALLDRLVAQDVHIARYYFDGDPRMCFPPGSLQRPIGLPALAQRHADHRLVICADARALFDPITGERARWSDALLRWKHRVLLTPETRQRWGRFENELAESFAVGRLTVQGFGALGGARFDASAERDDARFPEMLRRRPLPWIDRTAPAEAAIDEMLDGVRSYLDEDTWVWLAACARFPGLNWHLTLNLGLTIRGADGTPLFSHEGLAALARLPWFRHGVMPDWLRLRLLDELTPVQKRQVRRTLEALLVEAAEGRDEVDDIELAWQRPRVLDAFGRYILRRERRRAPKGAPVRDRIFVATLRGRSPHPLAVRVPRLFMDLFRPGGGAVAPGVRARIRRHRVAALASAAVLALAFFGGPAAWRLIPVRPLPPEQVAALAMTLPDAVPATAPAYPALRTLLAPFAPLRTPMALLVLWNVVALAAMAWLVAPMAARAGGPPARAAATNATRAGGIAAGIAAALSVFGGLFAGLIGVGRAAALRLAPVVRPGRARRPLLVLAGAAAGFGAFSALIATMVVGSVLVGRWTYGTLAARRAKRAARRTAQPTAEPQPDAAPQARRHLRTDAVAATFRLVAPGFYEAPIPDAGDPATLLLGVRADLRDSEIAARAPRIVKVGTASNVLDLVRRALPGLRLQLVDAPAGPAFRTDTTYFRVDDSASLTRSDDLGVYVPADLPDVELDLVAVPGILSGSSRTVGAAARPARRFPRVATLAAAGAAIVLFAFAGFSYVQGRAFAEEVRIRIAIARGVRDGSAVALQSLEHLRVPTEQLASYARNGTPWSMRVGLNADAVLADARAAYFTAFDTALWRDTRANLVGYLESLPEVPTASSQYDTTFAALKAYLITTDENARSTPDLLVPVLRRYWQGAGEPAPEVVDLASAQLAFFASELPYGNPYPATADPRLVSEVRTYLAQFSSADQLYASLIAQASASAPAVELATAVPGSAGILRNDRVVPGAFTADGWDLVHANLGDVPRFVAADEWVLGPPAPSGREVAALTSDLLARYTGDYTSVWMDVLRATRIPPYTSVADGSNKLAILGSNVSPLLRLLAVVTSNTNVDTTEVGPAFQPVRVVVPPDATGRLVGPSNQAYVAGLAELGREMEQLARSTGYGLAEGRSLDVLANIGAQVEAAIAAMALDFAIMRGAADVGGSLRQLLEAPLEAVVPLLGATRASDLNRHGQAFCATAAPILRKYPFNGESTDYATEDEVNRILRPAGSALSSLTEGLDGVIERIGSSYRGRTGAPASPSSSFLEMLNRLQALSDALYAADPNQPGFPYSLRAQLGAGMSEVTFVLGGARYTASPTAFTTRAVQWTLEGDRQAEIRAVVKDAPVTVASITGPWATFRLFRSARSFTNRGGDVVATWESPVGSVTVEMQFGANLAPFDPLLYEGLTCVPQVVR